MAGGTGGHVFPGLAVAEYMKKAGWHVVWLGTEGGMETSLAPRQGFEIETIRFSGFRRKGAGTWLMLPIRLSLALWQSAKVMLRVRPDVVLGMGGYPSFPGGLMASLLNKPLLIHEQNSDSGSRKQGVVQAGRQGVAGFSRCEKMRDIPMVFSGNPVRAEILQVEAPEKRYGARSGKLRLLVIGGSLGSTGIECGRSRLH